MQYSDHIDNQQRMHRNASNLGVPIARNQAVTIANLSPLNWQAQNNQHWIDNASIDKPSGKMGYGDNPSYATWHLRDYLVG